MKTSTALPAALLAASAALVAFAAPDRGPSDDTTPVDWAEVLGPKQGEWPEPFDELEWRTDLRAGMEEALRTGRPLLLTARCLPCKQCSTIDKQVLEGTPELTPLMKRFVTVRVTDAYDLDLGVLPVEGFQDFDLSWWIYMLSPSGEVYGVFGGRDEVSDTTRISVPALTRTLERVLDHHSDPRRDRWGIDGPEADLTKDPVDATTLAGHDEWKNGSKWTREQTCLHCHQLGEVLRQPAIAAGTFDVVRDVEIWPYPENVGLTLDRDHGLLVTAVAEDSAAARAGLRVGDRLGAAAGRRLHGQTDFRAALHREARPSGGIDVAWLRGDEVHEARLELEDGWRRTVLDWRMSISQGNIGPAPGFPFPLRGPAREGMSIKPFFGKDAASSLAYRAGLRPRHVIIAVNGESPALHGRAFLVWFRLHHDAGDEIVLTVLDRGKETFIRYTLPGS